MRKIILTVASCLLAGFVGGLVCSSEYNARKYEGRYRELRRGDLQKEALRLQKEADGERLKRMQIEAARDSIRYESRYK